MSHAIIQPARGGGGVIVAEDRLRCVYLSHCLRAATPEQVEGNRLAAATWGVWLSRTFRVAISADWIWLSRHARESPSNLVWGLACDMAHVQRCDALWMVGPVVSDGMKLELQHAHRHGVPVFDLTEIPKDEKRIRETLSAKGWRFAA